MSFKRNGYTYEDEDEYDFVMGIEAQSVAMGIQKDYPAVEKYRRGKK